VCQCLTKQSSRWFTKICIIIADIFQSLHPAEAMQLVSNPSCEFNQVLIDFLLQIKVKKVLDGLTLAPWHIYKSLRGSAKSSSLRTSPLPPECSILEIEVNSDGQWIDVEFKKNEHSSTYNHSLFICNLQFDFVCTLQNSFFYMIFLLCKSLLT